jgi:hypothetical protein
MHVLAERENKISRLWNILRSARLAIFVFACITAFFLIEPQMLLALLGLEFICAIFHVSQ